MATGKVTLTRHKGARHTVLVDGFQPYSIGGNPTCAGFNVPMPDGSELSVRLDRDLIATLARFMARYEP